MLTLKNIQPIVPKRIGQSPTIISGPCSAESENQVMETALQLQNIGINIFRAGIWKPRTRPNSFEGIGDKGLPWLKRVKEELGMSIITEVANTEHIQKALNYDVDMLWIGARTTANPFAMQEIANSLKGTNIPVFVKNPISPDLDLWIGGIERLLGAGLTRIGAIHRGFRSYSQSIYRNEPHWQIPIELRRRIPNISLLCDPSHISGSRKYIKELSQKAMDLQYDGLMIESHCSPDNAFSDKEQQLLPEVLGTILCQLILRQHEVSQDLSIQLDELRREIDKYDNELLDIIEKRMLICDRIGNFKKDHNITILQATRWDELLSERTNSATNKGLSAEFVEKIFSAIHQESINRQTHIMNNNV